MHAWTGRLIGVVVMVLGFGVLLTSLAGGKTVMHDRRLEAAVVRWIRNPSPKTEAELVRDRIRVQRVQRTFDLGLGSVGVAALVGGAALVARRGWSFESQVAGQGNAGCVSEVGLPPRGGGPTRRGSCRIARGGVR